MAATAIERAVVGFPVDPFPLGIDLLGEFPPSMEWALPAVVGAPVHLLRSAASARGLVDALHRATEGGDGAVLVVAMDGRPRFGNSGAVAFLFRESDGGPLSGAFEEVLDEGSAVEAAFSLYHAHGAGTSGTRWVGDWDAVARSGEVPAPSSTTVGPERATEGVSQGAYVPRARYLENLPSRWRFAAERCTGCGTVSFPTRGKCRNCGRRDALVPVDLPRDGALVVATTVIGAGGQPAEFDAQVEAQGPYEVVLAELAPGARVTLQLTDAVPGQVRIGDRVDTRLRRLYAMEGEWRYGRKAVPRALTAPT
jgi:uncharacterized OB-fold protein